MGVDDPFCLLRETRWTVGGVIFCDPRESLWSLLPPPCREVMRRAKARIARGGTEGGRKDAMQRLQRSNHMQKHTIFEALPLAAFPHTVRNNPFSDARESRISRDR